MFKDNDVIIPFAVLEELDKFKKQSDDVGRNAREVIRQLDHLRMQGHLAEGIKWNENGGTIRVELSSADPPVWLRGEAPDNRIIAVAWHLKEEGKRAILISKDINVRLKSDALGIPAEDFEAQKVDIAHLYAGYCDVAVPGELIDTLYEEKQLDLVELAEHLTQTDAAGQDHVIELQANEFVHLRDALDDSHTGLARRLADTDHLIPIHGPRQSGLGHHGAQRPADHGARPAAR